jgi:hypothetical protein
MFKRLFSGPVHYTDTIFQLIAIPLIAFTAHYLTYDGSDSTGWFIYEISSDIIKIFLVWTIVKLCILFLDRRIPWTVNPLRRLLYQLLLTGIVGLATLTILVVIDYSLFRPYPMNHYSFDLVIALLFILLVNAVYIVLYYHQSLQATRKNLEDTRKRQTESLRNNFFLVKLGRKELQVPLVGISLFYAKNKNAFLFTTEGQSYPVDLSLDQLEKEAFTAALFRANRQHLVSLSSISSIQSDASGKINVYLKQSPNKEEYITVSREKAAAFRQWFKG